MNTRQQLAQQRQAAFFRRVHRRPPALRTMAVRRPRGARFSDLAIAQINDHIQSVTV